MQIKELAERSGVTVKAVRYYESRGLLSPGRAANGYREVRRRGRAGGA
ncbi:MerR family DNA-binding transcriptional regulator [Nocardioides sp. TF02-7]|nr:MerR family DNA-binding transcriptional regulator [Nocardioides sp. TF02-7]UMG94465.1 MerR family DNA-binding transcriptional regulator [Nocardioides sp. TF02-7]